MKTKAIACAVLERLKKYWSHSVKRVERAVLLVFGFVSAQLQGFADLLLRRNLAKNQKSSLRIGYSIFLTALIFIVPGAVGQVSTNFLFRYRFPLLNDSLRCDLGPLYAWWTAQLDAKTNLPPTGRVGVGETNDVTIGRPMAP